MFKAKYDLTVKNVGHLNFLCDQAEFIFGMMFEEIATEGEILPETMRKAEKLLAKLRGEHD